MAFYGMLWHPLIIRYGHLDLSFRKMKSTRVPKRRLRSEVAGMERGREHIREFLCV